MDDSDKTVDDKRGDESSPRAAIPLNSRHVQIKATQNLLCGKRNFNAELINNSINGCCEWLMGITESFTLALMYKYLILMVRTVRLEGMRFTLVRAISNKPSPPERNVDKFNMKKVLL